MRRAIPHLDRASTSLARAAGPPLRPCVAGGGAAPRLSARLTSCLHSRASSSLRPSPRSTVPVATAVRSHSTSPAVPDAPIPPIADADTYDIVIIGGGPAGLALATALLSHKTLADTTRILLLEGGSLAPVRDWDDTGKWSNRVSSLTAENIEWLQGIGAWANTALPRSRAVDDIIVFANPDADATPMLHFPPADGPLARMTENINLQRALLRTVESLSASVPGGGVTVREGARVSEMRYGEGRGWVGLRLGEDSWVRGSLVIGADGPNSPARRFAQIDTFGHAYDAHGVVATLAHDVSAVWPNHTAFQRFLPTGPLAFLPLGDDASTMVWSTTPALAAALKRLSPAALVHCVNAGWTLPEPDLKVLQDALLSADSMGAPLSEFGVAGVLATFPPPPISDAPLPPHVTGVDGASVASFPLRLSHADSYTAHRVALVGDAAHTTHPLAGQGLNAGLADARVLASTLASARGLGADLGSVTALAPYPRDRYLPNHIMLAAVDKLNSVFGARNPLINWARGTGLEVINELTPLKAFFMANAGSGKHAPRTTDDRTYGRQYADEPLSGRPAGLPAALATAVEGVQVAQSVVSAAGDVIAAGLKNALRRGADALEQREHREQGPK